MPHSHTCSHCRFVVVLPDDWTTPGWTCPQCRRPNVVPSAPAAVLVQQTIDDRPARSAFGTAFGLTTGCAVGAAAVVVGGLLLVAALIVGAMMFSASTKVREVERRAQEARDAAPSKAPK